MALYAKNSTNTLDKPDAQLSDTMLLTIIWKKKLTCKKNYLLNIYY